MTEQKLRVNQVAAGDPNHVHNPTDPNIPVVTEGRYKGLRVRDHGKHELVSNHPAQRRHPDPSIWELERLFSRAQGGRGGLASTTTILFGGCQSVRNGLEPRIKTTSFGVTSNISASIATSKL